MVDTTKSTGRPRSLYLVAALQLVAVVGMISYWSLYFGQPEAVQIRPNDRCYIVFENAFPLADAWIVVASAMGAIGVLRARPYGLFFSLTGGSAVLFLALMDLLYDLQHGIFVPLNGPAATELAIVVTCIIGGPLVAVLAWRQRRFLLRA